MSIPVPSQSKLEIERQRYKALLMNTKEGALSTAAAPSSHSEKHTGKEFDIRSFSTSYNHGSYSPQSPSRKLNLQSLDVSNDPMDSLLSSPVARMPLFDGEPDSARDSLTPLNPSNISPRLMSNFVPQFSNDDKDNVIIVLQEENQELKHKLNACIDAAESNFRDLEESIINIQAEYELKISELEAKLQQSEAENNELKISLELKQSMLDVESDELRKALLIIQRLGYNQSSFLKSQAEFHKVLKLSSTTANSFK